MRKAAITIFLFFAAIARAEDVTVIRAARLIDGTGAAPVAFVSVRSMFADSRAIRRRTSPKSGRSCSS